MVQAVAKLRLLLPAVLLVLPVFAAGCDQDSGWFVSGANNADERFLLEFDRDGQWAGTYTLPPHSIRGIGMGSPETPRSKVTVFTMDCSRVGDVTVTKQRRIVYISSERAVSAEEHQPSGPSVRLDSAWLASTGGRTCTDRATGVNSPSRT